MESFKKIEHKNWWKFWALNISLLNASMLCKNFMKFMHSQIGVDFDNTVIVSMEGHTTNFLVAEERQKFGKYLVKKYVKNGDVSQVCKALNKKTDGMFETMKKLMDADKITNAEFSKFLGQSYDYNGFYTVPRAIIDYIDKSLVDTVIDELRDARKHAEPIYTQVEEVTKKFAVQISKETGYKSESILCMLIDEFENYLETGELPKEKILKKRLKACGVIFNKKQVVLILNQDEIRQLENINVKDSSIKEVKGNIAFKGHAKGMVRIIHDPYKCKNFNEGDILITGMTRPEFLPLMKKAGAIVTDAGGLLCHAAIVAREFGKPCVIGTQISTKVFKDGDIVEVDANIGIVKIL